MRSGLQPVVLSVAVSRTQLYRVFIQYNYDTSICVAIGGECLKCYFEYSSNTHAVDLLLRRETIAAAWRIASPEVRDRIAAGIVCMLRNASKRGTGGDDAQGGSRGGGQRR